jgi:hypothetical protein
MWGLIAAAALVFSALTLFVGLAVVMPVLGHATWRPYRRAVVREARIEPPVEQTCARDRWQETRRSSEAIRNAGDQQEIVDAVASDKRRRHCRCCCRRVQMRKEKKREENTCAIRSEERNITGVGF